MTPGHTPPTAGAPGTPPADAPRTEDLAAALVPTGGIHSHTLHTEGGVSVVHFAFAAGEELSEHTSSRPALIHVLSGELDMTVAGRAVDGRAGTWVSMPAGTVHALRARGPATILLTLLPRRAER